jgi:hypothetical protein
MCCTLVQASLESILAEKPMVKEIEHEVLASIARHDDSDFESYRRILEQFRLVTTRIHAIGRPSYTASRRLPQQKRFSGTRGPRTSFSHSTEQTIQAMWKTHRYR